MTEKNVTQSSIDVSYAVRFLNSLLEVDRVAVSHLFERHVPCNAALDNHPTVQIADDGVGVLGLLNGLFGTDEKGWGFIASVYEDNDPFTIVKFIVRGEGTSNG